MNDSVEALKSEMKAVAQVVDYVGSIIAREEGECRWKIVISNEESKVLIEPEQGNIEYDQVDGLVSTIVEKDLFSPLALTSDDDVSYEFFIGRHIQLDILPEICGGVRIADKFSMQLHFNNVPNEAMMTFNGLLVAILGRRNTR